MTSQWSVPIPQVERTVLSLAIQHLTEDQLRHLLSLAQPVTVNIQDDWSQKGNAPLHIAAAYGHLKLVVDLVEKYGAEIEVYNSDSQTPAFYAFLLHRQDVLNYLEQKGADVKFVRIANPKDHHATGHLESGWCKERLWTPRTDPPAFSERRDGDMARAGKSHRTDDHENRRSSIRNTDIYE